MLCKHAMHIREVDIAYLYGYLYWYLHVHIFTWKDFTWYSLLVHGRDNNVFGDFS